MNDESALTREMAISEAVSRGLHANERTKRYTIDVAMQGATVSLRGAVDHHEDKVIAEQVARQVDGVVDVTNELVVNEHTGLGWPKVGGVVAAPAPGATGGGGAGYGTGVFVRPVADETADAGAAHGEDSEEVKG